MAYRLGVDLGTTYTAAAVWRNGRVEVATLGTRAPTIPSVLFLRDDDTILVGEAASRRGMSEPGRVVREFKRRFGDPTPIMVGGSPMAADLLMARLLSWVVETVTAAEGEAPEGVGITHPANWGPYKRDLLDQAIRQSGAPSPTTLSEPEAAAISYAAGERVEPGQVVAVYDLGGGTFDAAVLRRTEDSFEVLGRPEGIERVGGVDFDQAVFAHVAANVGMSLADLDPDDPAVQAAVARLREECVSAKEALSSDTDVTIPVLLPTSQSEVRLTRGEFENLIRPTLAPTVEALARTITGAGLTPPEINVVLLVGGSSRIPLVGQLVAAEIGVPVAVNAHPKHVVATGAAISAAGGIRAREGASAAEAAGAVAIVGGAAAAGSSSAAAAAAAAGSSSAAAADGSSSDHQVGEPELPATTPPVDETAVLPEKSIPPVGADGAPEIKGAGPPPIKPTAGSKSGKGPAAARRRAVVAAVVVVALLLTVVVLSRGGDDEADRPVVATAQGEIFLEPAGEAGPDPFTESVAASGLPSVQPASPGGEAGDGTAAVSGVRGDQPGLYGGTRDNSTCDAAKLVTFLQENPAKAAAFAEVLGIPPADIAAYVDTLTPVILLTDTRVTNHGFKDGRPSPRQAVLQAGTAVMIDRAGRPRVKCFCGNPLADPVAAEAAVSYTGNGWPGFDKSAVTVVSAATSEVTDFTLAELNPDGTTGTPFARPFGTQGEADRPMEDSGDTTTTVAAATTTTKAAGASTTVRAATTLPRATAPPQTSPATTTPAATTPKTAKSIISEGSVSASSTYSGEFPAGLSVDGSSATSWFSTGGATTTYTWSGSAARQVTKVAVIGNANHSNSEFRTNFGFGSVVVQLLDSGGGTVFTQELSLSGTPDPNVSVTMPHDGVMAKSVKLTFKTPEAPGVCGGFSELQITALV